MEYEVLSLIWHTKDGIYYSPGAVVRLDHLSKETIEGLIAQGVVKPIKEQKKKEND